MIAKYLTSVVSTDKIIRDEVSEFAFVGRSNVGKSSIINSITNMKKLAKTSSTPGLTKMLNYFEIKEDGYVFRLVDLPGYGFAKADKKSRSKWDNLFGEYLKSSSSLLNVFVLIDIRIGPTELDLMMINYLESFQKRYTIIATKADKLSKAKYSSLVNQYEKALNREVIPYSSITGCGKERIIELMIKLVKENS